MVVAFEFFFFDDSSVFVFVVVVVTGRFRGGIVYGLSILSIRWGKACANVSCTLLHRSSLLEFGWILDPRDEKNVDKKIIIYILITYYIKLLIT